MTITMKFITSLRMPEIKPWMILSPAVSNLEVKDAILKGLHSNVNQLDKLLKASCGGEGCDCNIKKFRDDLKNLQDTFKKYDDLETKINGLKKQKDIAEKSEASLRTPSVGGPEIESLTKDIEKLKKEIFSQIPELQKEITTVIDAVQSKITELDKKKKDVDSLQSQVNELKKQIEEGEKNLKSPQKYDENELKRLQEELQKAKNNFPEKDSKSLNSHNVSMKSLETLNKLCGYADKIQKNDVDQNSSTDILKNLTEGLEKFLGYNKDSKGYSGEGIVYSDLDRLCDGVMSFLHGVLQSVKDDDNVITYNKHITQNNLDNVLKLLTSSIGKGRSGLSESVTKVKEWLGRYEGEVNKKCEDVKKPINGLCAYIVSQNKRIEELKQLPVESHWEHWNRQVGRFAGLANEADKARDKLDQELKKKLETPTKLIVQAAESFEKSMQNDDVKKVVDQVEAQMKTLEEYAGEVEEQAKQKAEDATRYINESIQNLAGKFRKINSDVEDKQLGLQQLVSEASAALTQARQNKHYMGLLDHNIKEALWADVQNIRSQFDALSISTLQGAIEQLVPQIGEAIGKMSESVVGTKENMKGFVQKLKQKIGNDIKGNSGSGGGLTHIIDSIRDYAHNYSKDIFEDIFLYPWVADIVEKNVIVKPWVDGYIKPNNGNFKNRELTTDQKKREAVITAITAEMNKIVIEVRSKNSSAHDGDVGNNLQSIKTFLDHFADELGKKIDAGDEGKVVTAIDTELLNGKSTYPAQSSLKSALRIIMPVLATSARQTAEEISSLVTSCSIASLNDMLDIVGSLESKLDTQFAQALDGAIKNVADKVGELSSDFENSFKKSLGDAVEGIETTYDELQQLSETLNGQEGIPKAVSLMNELYDNLSGLQDKVNDIRLASSTAEQYLNKDMQGAVNQTKALVQRYIENTARTLMEKGSTALNTIKADAQEKYVLTKKAELEALKSFVSAKLQDVTAIINQDKVTGLKGFFSKMHIYIVNQVNDYVSKLSGKQLSADQKTLKHFAEIVRLRFYDFMEALYPQEDFQKVRRFFDPSRKSLHDLLTDLISSEHFDYTFSNNLDNLNNALHNFELKRFSGPCSPLLDPLKEGISAMARELGRTYISKYCCVTFNGALLQNKKQPATGKPDTSQPEKELTEEGRNCARVCLTILDMLFHDLSELKQQCNHTNGPCRDKQINTHGDSPLGPWFINRGYTVNSENGKQTGELQDNKKMEGSKINEKLITEFPSAKANKHLKDCSAHTNMTRQYNVMGILTCLFTHLKECYQVGHHATLSATKSPTTINEMLQWCSGFPYNYMYHKVGAHVKTLFPKPKGKEQMSYNEIPDTALSLAATTAITPRHVTELLDSVCRHAEQTLIAIQGHGHADGQYACDYSNNSLDLHYPVVPSQCVALLVELICRLYEQLIFLYQQCKNGQIYSGWNKCWYGQGVAGSSWSCNTLQCPNQTGDQTANQKADQTHNQTCNQNCKQHSDCGIKSPLQSYLEDGLVGFLPHQLTKLGCGVACSLGSHRGQPCITPMGFPDLSVMASHRQTGRYLEEVLADFCGKPDKPLSKLCSALTCISKRTPLTLGDLFAFYINFLDKWNSNDGHKRYAFIKAVQSANFGDPKTTLEIGPMFKSAVHGSDNKHPNADLHSLVKCESNSGDAALPCGPYLKPICRDIWSTFSSKNSSKYLSWIVYLSETFYDLLKKLYDDCCATCDRKGSRCYEKCCTEKCPVKYTDKNGQSTTPSIRDTHTPDCSSIVKCPHTLRTLSKYGFYFGSSWRMSGERGEKTKRTCRDLCRALDRVLSKKKAEQPALAKLIYETIPEFLFKIRAPFIWTLVALWSLSLLYLLHILIVRLDVLRIRSHLRSPSSHRIAAQSLLAAARVKALANVKYFSP
ncbi:hypothetical protein, conserved [Babesia ovata]|uniref:C3H1-type domain-containing protein n=1 Tax=Babesia ovata TaxID=189622 RepID=A0A2H6KJX6_9APIC|nr:uncharacterized protein BOVATA_047980 [Babesia ovata]GBE63305.1 hypothetical protein, conserved [Babesia ovata]